jgi:hypothetical protein
MMGRIAGATSTVRPVSTSVADSRFPARPAFPIKTVLPPGESAKVVADEQPNVLRIRAVHSNSHGTHRRWLPSLSATNAPAAVSQATRERSTDHAGKSTVSPKWWITVPSARSVSTSPFTDPARYTDARNVGGDPTLAAVLATGVAASKARLLRAKATRTMFRIFPRHPRGAVAGWATEVAARLSALGRCASAARSSRLQWR